METSPTVNHDNLNLIDKRDNLTQQNQKKAYCLFSTYLNTRTKENYRTEGNWSFAEPTTVANQIYKYSMYS